MIRSKPAFALLIVMACLGQAVNGQSTEKWDLKKCVEYALTNNISVRQADLQIRFAQLDFQQSKLAQYPTANFSTSLVYGAGRNQDRLCI
jgi:outer membrane protein